MERPGDIGPSAFNRVPNEKPLLQGYEKPSFDRVFEDTFTDAEKDAITAISTARSHADLNAAKEMFMSVTSPKSAEELKISLDVMEIINQPIKTLELDEFAGVRVVLNRSKQGVSTLHIEG